jgi:signal peptidase II
MVLWFVLLSVLAVVGILYWLFFLGEARALWLTIALGGITAGIFGNLYDRVGMHGLVWPGTIGAHQRGTPIYAVRDWILLQWDNQLRWPNFNIADSLLVVGAILLLLHAYFLKRQRSRAGDPQHPKRPLSAESHGRR